MRGVFDRAGPRRRLAKAPSRVSPSLHFHGVGAPELKPFHGSIPGLRAPCQRFAAVLANERRMTRGRCGSLALHRTALSSAASHRFHWRTEIAFQNVPFPTKKTNQRPPSPFSITPFTKFRPALAAPQAARTSYMPLAQPRFHPHNLCGAATTRYHASTPAPIRLY